MNTQEEGEKGAENSESEAESVEIPSEETDEKDSHWSGSGIWEWKENRRWEVVSDPVIPSRSRPAAETYMVKVGLSHYLSSFEAEVAAVSENSRIIQSGSAIIRITENLEENEEVVGGPAVDPPTSDGGEESAAAMEPVAGPSGCQHRHHSDSLPVDASSSSAADQSSAAQAHTGKAPQWWTSPARRKRSRRQRRWDRRQGTSEPERSRARKMYVKSAESSPGRDSPSPASLARIVLYWDRLREEEEGRGRTDRKPVMQPNLRNNQTQLVSSSVLVRNTSLSLSDSEQPHGSNAVASSSGCPVTTEGGTHLLDDSVSSSSECVIPLDDSFAATEEEVDCIDLDRTSSSPDITRNNNNLIVTENCIDLDKTNSSPEYVITSDDSN